MSRFGRRDRDYLAHLSHALFGDDNTGPGRSGGEFQNSVVTYNTPRSEGDYHSKTHDREYAQAVSERDLENADYKYFQNQIGNPELKYKFAAAAVGAQGVARTAKRKFLDVAWSPFDTPVVRPSKRTQKMAEAIAVDAEGTTESMAAASRSATSSSAGGKGSETQLIPLPQHIAFGIPKVYTCKHNLYSNVTIVYTSTGSGSMSDNTNDIQINLNSIYDCIPTHGSPQPTWRDWAANYWDKYSVIGCDVNISVTSMYPEQSNGAQTSHWIYFKDYGSITPASTAEDYANLARDPSMHRVLWTYDPNKNTGGNRANFSKFYTYADYDKLREVVQDSADNIWTDKASDPSLVWRLRVMPRPLVNQDENRAFVVEVKCVYTVQWRELNATYRFWTS